VSGVAISPVPVVTNTDAVIWVRGCSAVSVLVDCAKAVPFRG
jgi:hypothetical protein